LRDTLASLVERDSEAYAAVIEAMRLPKATDAEKQQRRAAIEAAMREAIEVPMDTMRACQQALRGAVVVAKNGNLNASTDTGTAVLMLMASRVECGREPEERVRCRVGETRERGAGSADG
jgi:formiminotetrahydrofolate cyclodeaminase